MLLPAKWGRNLLPLGIATPEGERAAERCQRISLQSR